MNDVNIILKVRGKPNEYQYFPGCSWKGFFPISDIIISKIRITQAWAMKSLKNFDNYENF